MIYTHLGLGVLTTVEEYAEAVEVDDLPAAVSCHGGQGSAGAEYGDVVVHRMLDCLIV